jgi:ELWxxDGT repeat protein
MKSSSWRRSWQSSHGGKKIRRVARGGRKTLGLLVLEDRTVPTGTPHMVLDINPRTLDSSPGGIVAVGSTAYFAASDGSSVGLWKSDGTAAGTSLIKEFHTGGSDYQPIRYLTNMNGTIYFSGNDGTNGRELWKSDGTVAGTVLVKDIFPGTYAGYSGTTGNSSSPGPFTSLNGTLYFSADDGAHGRELWKTDGTAAGTVMFKDINVGGAASIRPDSGSYLSNRPVIINGVMFFPADDGTHGYELWKSDGTAAGTVMVKDIDAGSAASNAGNLINVNGTLFFAADDGAHGTELWKSDGTAAGTALVKDIWANGSAGSLPGGYHGEALTTVGGTLYFRANDGKHGYELWKSDGTAKGTTLVKDVRSGSANSYPTNLTNLNGAVYFSAYDGSGTGLWKSDGTTAGTTLVKEIYPSFGGSIGSLTNVNGTLFFGANQLWKSDGTAAGTVTVNDVPGSVGSAPGSLVNVNGALFFAADDGVHGRELFKSNGTAAGTVLVKDINATPLSSSPANLTTLNGALLFTADDGSHGEQIWKSDGTAAGTALISHITPRGSGSYYYGPPPVADLANVNGTLFFVANDEAYGDELWRSDGTAAGTALVMDIWPGFNAGSYSENSSAPDQLTNVNGTLFFVANDGVHGRELWKSTAAGTVMVKDIGPGYSTAGPSGLTNVNGTLFFTADDGAHGPELWKSDGTDAGTVLVADINPGSAGSNPGSTIGSKPTNVNGTLYFPADDGVHGVELWKSDGTAAGTKLVKDISPGTIGSSPAYLTNVNGTLYFTANDGNGVGLWKSDGTAAGTTLLREISTGSSGAADSLTSVNGRLFFAADDGAHGKEVWTSDGTAAGTMMVSDIYSGTAGSFPTTLTSVNGKLYFAAYDGVHGQELWQSDGTAAGTMMVADINPGSLGSAPGGFGNGIMVVINGTLSFSADDGVHGRELWAFPPAPPTVGAVEVNDGSSQRSEVKSITVTFSEAVSFAGGTANAAAAFRLTHVTDGVAVGLTAAVSSDGSGDTVVTLTFSGTETDSLSALHGGTASLADGRYSLTIVSSQVSANGQALAGGAANGDWVSPTDTFGGNGLHLYRLFGDANGDGVVDPTDLNFLRNTFNVNNTQANYWWYLDANGDGVVDPTDLNQFRSRFNANVF